jgi:hypothetical protein
VSRRNTLAPRATTRTAEGDRRRAGTLELHNRPLGGRARVRPPDRAAPFWREGDGSRHSYGSLRCGLDPGEATALRDAHLAAIGQIAAAALEASERGDRRETVRLASAAARLCGEIRGLWAPSAVEIPMR